MFSDDDVFREMEKIIENKKRRYERALKWEEDVDKISEKVTNLENSLIDAYVKYIRTKYWVKERKIVGGVDAEKEIEEFFELIGEE